jgi:hypothetical protein
MKNYRNAVIQEFAADPIEATGLKALNEKTFTEKILAPVTSFYYSKFSKMVSSIGESFSSKSASKGNFEKYELYKNCHDAVQAILSHNPSCAVARDISELMNNLKKYKLQYMKAFVEKEDITIVFYNSQEKLVSSVLALLIAHADIKDDTATFPDKVDFLENHILVKTLRENNDLYRNGKINEYLKTSSPHSLQESPFVFLGLGIGGLIAIIYVVRTTIYYFYKMRDFVAKESTIIAEYLKLNAASLKGESGDKQMAYANNLEKLASKFKIDDDAVTKQVTKEITQDKQEIKDVSNPSSVTDVNSANALL